MDNKFIKAECIEVVQNILLSLTLNGTNRILLHFEKTFIYWLMTFLSMTTRICTNQGNIKNISAAIFYFIFHLHIKLLYIVGGVIWNLQVCRCRKIVLFSNSVAVVWYNLDAKQRERALKKYAVLKKLWFEKLITFMSLFNCYNVLF